MTRDSIADRLVNYSDAIVAFSLVNSLAFLIALRVAAHDENPEEARPWADLASTAR